MICRLKARIFAPPAGKEVRVTVIKKIVLRGIFAVVTGVAVIAAVIFFLFSYGASAPESAPQVSLKSLPFPENEKMLDALAATLAGEAADFSKIAPAAGNPPPKPQH